MWKRKEEDKIQIHDNDKVQTEWDEVLAAATEEELVDLAGALPLYHCAILSLYHYRSITLPLYHSATISLYHSAT